MILEYIQWTKIWIEIFFIKKLNMSMFDCPVFISSVDM